MLQQVRPYCQHFLGNLLTFTIFIPSSSPNTYPVSYTNFHPISVSYSRFIYLWNIGLCPLFYNSFLPPTHSLSLPSSCYITIMISPYLKRVCDSHHTTHSGLIIIPSVPLSYPLQLFSTPELADFAHFTTCFHSITPVSSWFITCNALCIKEIRSSSCDLTNFFFWFFSFASKHHFWVLA